MQAFKIVIDSSEFSILLLYILWDDWPIFMISASNEQLQQQLEYTLPKSDCHSWWISKMPSGCEEEWYAIKFCFKLGKNATETYGMLQTAFQPSCMNWASVFEWHKRFKEGTESVRMMRGVGGVRKSIHQSWLAEELGLELLCWDFKGVQEEILSEEASTLQIGSVTFPAGQCTSPSLSQITWPRWASRQFLSLPTVQTLLPVTFAYSLSLEAVVMRQLKRWKKLWWRSLTHSHKKTYMGPSRSCWNGTTNALLPEEITLKRARVLCVYYQWKCPYEKRLETYLMILVYIHTHTLYSILYTHTYIYIYIYVCVCVCVSLTHWHND